MKESGERTTLESKHCIIILSYFPMTTLYSKKKQQQKKP